MSHVVPDIRDLTPVENPIPLNPIPVNNNNEQFQHSGDAADVLRVPRL